MNDPAAGGQIDRRSVCVGARTRRNMLGVRDEQVRSAELEIPLNPRHHADIRTCAHAHTLLL